MNKFLISNIEFEDAFNFGGNSFHGSNSPNIRLELRSVEFNNADIKKLSNIMKSNRTISLNDTAYNNWVEPFKNEFKEFLLDKHPEKILLDVKGFEQLFGAS